jgi:predicted Zn-ribbon and HTH transcriptional regulator
MALRILPASEPITVNRITVAIYAPPGVGKTTLAYTASKPLLIDFDQGAHRATNRKDTVQAQSWRDVADLDPADLDPFDTVIVDTAGRALDALAVDIIRRDAKLGRGGVLSQQGWGRLKAEFVGWMKLLNQAGKDVILIAHSSEKINGDETIERLDVQGGSKDEIYKSVDAMGRIAIRGGKRVLIFDPTETAFGKNPAQLPPLEIPHTDAAPDFMAGVIQQTKDALNNMSEAAREEQKRVSELRSLLDQLETADAFNEKVKQMKDAPKKDKALLMVAAENKGFAFDDKAKAFVARAA